MKFLVDAQIPMSQYTMRPLDFIQDVTLRFLIRDVENAIAQQAARQFWGELAAHQDVSGGFRQIAEVNFRVLG